LFGTPYNLVSGQPDSSGSWAALDPATGGFIWQDADPNRSADVGPASEANGVVYVGDTVWFGHNMFALDAATGKILWSFAATGSEYAGAAIVNGTVYWGSGYDEGLPSKKFYAFTLGGH
jgi:polyvinyl alcohol dehydrogenase (cytochrome)